MWLMRPSGTAVAHVALPLRPAEDLGNSSSTPGGTRTALTWTPDGQSLVFVGRQNDAPLIYVRPLDASEARPLKGTEGAYAPAVSPDGTWVAFWAKRTIRKVLLAGGPVVDVAPGGDAAPWGLVWGADNAIYWGRQDGVIWQIPC